MKLEDSYYLLNNIWVYGNLVMIPPFVIACIMRFKNPDINKKLWTDHLSRLFLVLTVLFYVVDIIVKYFVDGGNTICQKAFFIHHVASLALLPPLFMNSYIPWWVNPVGFLHGICIFFPQFEPMNYIYATFLFVFQYGTYQKPYCDLKGYWLSRYLMNFIWIFALLLLLGDCSNFLPLKPS